METNNKIQITVKNVAQINKPNQDKEVIPLKVDQTITADDGNVLDKVLVKAIPSDYVKPEGELIITSSGKYDVKNYESVNAKITAVLISIPIDSSKWVSDTSLYPYNQKAVVIVNLGDLTTNSILRLINDNESEGIFAKYGFYCLSASKTSITIYSIDKPLIDIILKAEITYRDGESGTPTIVNPVSIVRKDKLVDITNKTVQEILPSDLEGATQISNNLFSDCTLLEKVELPDSVTSIGNGSFSRCTFLKNVILPKNLETIGSYTFSECSNISSIIIPNTVINMDAGICYKCSNLTSVVIGNNVKSIGYDSFWYCYKLTSIIIPDSVTSIGQYAFASCTSLTSITIPNSVTTIGNSAFGGCSNLTNIEIPDSVTNIGGGVFSGCNSLKNLTLGKGVKSIGSNTFHDCINLQNVYYTGTVTELVSINYTDNTIFEHAQNLFINGELVTVAEFDEGLTTIYDGFRQYVKLTKVVAPSTLTRIDQYAFAGCTALKEIIINKHCTKVSEVPTLASTNAIPANAYIYVPDTTTQALYQSSTNWSSFASRILIKA